MDLFGSCFFLKGEIKMKKWVKNIVIDCVGGLLIAVGVYNFAAQCGFPMAGISGIALILYKLFHLPIGTMTLLMNIPIIVCCFKVLGKTFFFRSLQTMIISSIMMDIVAPMFPVFQGDLMLAAICTGFVTGLGYAIIYSSDTSTGGMDFIIMMIRSIKPHLSFGNITLMTDITIIAIGGLLFKNFEGMIYGFVLTYIVSSVIDRVIMGADKGKMAFIVTEVGDKVSAKIHEYTERGSTLLNAEGSFSKEEKQVVMCACNNKQIHLIQKAVKEVDENAFMVIMESSEVRGEGFKPH